MVADRMRAGYNFRMTKLVKLISIGNSTGVILPKDLLQRLGVAQGDQLAVTDTPTGIELHTPDEDFEREMSVAREVMQRRRRALRELAK